FFNAGRRVLMTDFLGLLADSACPCMRERGALCLPDLHAPYQAVFYQIDVLDHALRNKVPFQIADYLMNLNDSAPRLIGAEADRLYVRIDRGPLARPVITDAIVSINPPAFPTVRPIDIRAHGGQDSVNVAGVERAVDVPEQIVICRHRNFTPHLF